MYTLTKKATVFALALLMLVMSVFVPMKKAEAAMMYNNTSSATARCSIDSNGNLSVALKVTGYSGITQRIEVALYVEKRVLGIFWSRVDIGCPNNIWTDSKTGYTYTNTFSHHLGSTGTFRVNVTFTVSGTGGSNDIITKTETISY